MNEERQSLLNQLNYLKTRSGQIKGRIQYLERKPDVRNYKDSVSEKQFCDNELKKNEWMIHSHCYPVFYQVGLSKEDDWANYWELECVSCGLKKERIQFEDLDKEPEYEDVIFNNNKQGLSLKMAQRIYAEHEKMEGPEKAAEYVLALSRTPKGLK